MSLLLNNQYEQNDMTSSNPQQPDPRTSSISGKQSELHEQVRLFTEKYKTVIDRVIAFSRLSANWDSYGGVPPSIGTCVAASGLVGVWMIIAKQLGKELPLPFVAPCGNGSIQIEWTCGKKELEIEITSDSPHTFRWLAVLETEEDYEEKSGIFVFTSFGPQEILIRWLTADN